MIKTFVIWVKFSPAADTTLAPHTKVFKNMILLDIAHWNLKMS